MFLNYYKNSNSSTLISLIIVYTHIRSCNDFNLDPKYFRWQIRGMRYAGSVLAACARATPKSGSSSSARSTIALKGRGKAKGLGQGVKDSRVWSERTRTLTRGIC